MLADKIEISITVQKKQINILQYSSLIAQQLMLPIILVLYLNLDGCILHLDPNWKLLYTIPQKIQINFTKM